MSIPRPDSLLAGSSPLLALATMAETGQWRSLDDCSALLCVHSSGCSNASADWPLTGLQAEQIWVIGWVDGQKQERREMQASPVRVSTAGCVRGERTRSEVDARPAGLTWSQAQVLARQTGVLPDGERACISVDDTGGDDWPECWP